MSIIARLSAWFRAGRNSRPVRRSSRRLQLAVEQLERRELLSASITLPSGPLNVNHDFAFGIPIITVADPGVSTNDTVYLQVGAGALAVAAPAQTSLWQNGSALIGVTGSISALNLALSSVVYYPSPQFSGTVPLSATLKDQNANVMLAVAPGNIAPTIAGPTAQQASTAGATFSLVNGNPISVSDADGGNGSDTVYIQDLYGSLTLASSAGLTVTGSGSSSLVLVGSVANLNAALNGLQYHSPTAGASDLLNILVSDAGNTNGLAKSASLSTRVSITRAADVAPFVSGPSAATFNAFGVKFFPNNGNAIFVSDGDANGATETAYLQVSTGTLTPGSTTGVSVNWAPTSHLLTLTGTISALNNALNGLNYAPAAGVKADYLSILLSDRTLTGSLGVSLTWGDSTSKPPIPTDTITGAPANGQSPAGTAITLGSTLQGTTPGIVYSYAWQVLKNGVPFASGIATSLTFTPNDVGTYAVTLTVTDSYSQAATASTTITGTEVPPTPTITPPSSLLAGTAATFTASATDPSTVVTAAGFSYSWNFGDGSGAVAGATPSHTFATAGNHTVTLTATDKNGGVGTTTLSVTVAQPPVSATFSGPASVNEGTTTAAVTFTNVTGGTGGYKYSYDFNDDGTFEITNTSSASATIPESFVDDGPSTDVVHGRVTDSSGNFKDYTFTITVVNVAPTPKITLPSSPVAQTAASFTASATDPSTADTKAGFTFSWTFGDGTGAVTGANPSHTYASAGTYTVTLTATDKNGGVGTTSLSVTVAPQVSATFSGPASVNEGTTAAAVTFTNVTGGTGGYKYSYDFNNDGTFEISNSTSASATIPESYLDDGPATDVVHGRVTDSNGDFQDYTFTITVVNVAPTPKITLPSSPVAQTAASFTASATDPSTADTKAGFTFSWNFGDGTGAVPGANPSHTYASAGTYTVTLTATDKNGGVGTTTLSVTVAQPPVSATFSGPASVNEGTTTAAVNFTNVTGGTGGYKYSYDFNDDGTFEITNSSSASATIPESYLDDGPATDVVHGRVTDSSGDFKDYTFTITVANVAPTPKITPPSSPVAQTTASFTASATDPSTADTNAGFTYRWNFGDGSSPVTGATPSHTYAAGGTYTVTLTATDKNGGVGTTTLSVTVTSLVLDGPPYAVVGSAVTFTVTNPNQAPAGGFTYSWAFGDGATDTTAVPTDTHAYSAAGTYTVNLTVTDTDGGGGVGTATASVTIGTPAVNEPLLYQSNVQYIGAFRVPPAGDSAGEMSYGGTALAYNPADNSLFLVGFNPNGDKPIEEISIPNTIVNSSNLADLTTGTVLQPWVSPLSNLTNKLSGASDGTKIGGLMVNNGQLIGTVYAYYSGAASQVLSHFVLSSLDLSTATVGGLYQVGSGGRVLAGYMTPIPTEWQAALGGYTALTGLSDVPIVSSSSSGPAAFGFNPSEVASGTSTDTAFLDYPSGSPLGAYNGPADPIQNGNTTIGGAVFVPGTSSVLYIGSTGASYSGYGETGPWGDNVVGGKGPHTLNGQYSFQVLAYNANDFAAVQQGKLNPSQVTPYDVWNFTVPLPGNDQVGGVAYDPSTGRLYVSVEGADRLIAYSYLPLVYVFQVNLPKGTPAPAAPEIGTLTGAPSITPNPSFYSSDGAEVPQWVGTYAGNINAGDPVILTAGNVYAITPGASVTQVAFFLVTNTVSNQLLGYGTPDTVDRNATQNYQLTLATTGMASGTYTIIAQATDSDGLISDPIAMTLTIA